MWPRSCWHRERLTLPFRNVPSRTAAMHCTRRRPLHFISRLRAISAAAYRPFHLAPTRCPGASCSRRRNPVVGRQRCCVRLASTCHSPSIRSDPALLLHPTSHCQFSQRPCLFKCIFRGVFLEQQLERQRRLFLVHGHRCHSTQLCICIVGRRFHHLLCNLFRPSCPCSSSCSSCGCSPRHQLRH